MNSVFDKVKETIITNSLIQRGDSVLIGLSGGADSVCLTHILSRLADEWELTLRTAHLNHGIRGADAERDARFAMRFSESLGIECEIKNADVPRLAESKGISEELAGRGARYEFFNEACEKYGINKIATAHNRCDNAETLAMNFMRGAALAGLCGIPYSRGNVVRPLLDVTRAEIEEYCRENGLEYVTDSTNLENRYTRNKVRHYLIPLIEKEFNPNFINTAAKNSRIIKEDENFIAQCADAAYKKIVNGNSAEISELLKCHSALRSRIIRAMMSCVTDLNDVSSDYIDDITALLERGKTGASLNLPRGVTARIEYGKLVIEKEKAPGDYEYALTIGEEAYIREAGIYIRAEMADERINDGARYFSGMGEAELAVRNRRSGDRFYPAGMTGSKKLKDYFIDEKIPRNQRNTIPIVTFGGEIAYIVGRRADERFKFTGKGIKIFVSDKSMS
ncbi:MAG: tRNA lysidine(34) synthetase TilS [Firmicutes bacterium]|nr:tRNA lysidine(34) synthetase TilS [Bacillota bacterium]